MRVLAGTRPSGASCNPTSHPNAGRPATSTEIQRKRLGQKAERRGSSESGGGRNGGLRTLRVYGAQGRNAPCCARIQRAAAPNRPEGTRLRLTAPTGASQPLHGHPGRVPLERPPRQNCPATTALGTRASEQTQQALRVEAQRPRQTAKRLRPRPANLPPQQALKVRNAQARLVTELPPTQRRTRESVPEHRSERRNLHRGHNSDCTTVKAQPPDRIYNVRQPGGN